MVNFYPVWTTLAGPLPSVVENDNVSEQLVAVRSARFMGDDSNANVVFGNTIVEIGPSVAYLANVSVNSQLLANSAYTVITNAIQFHQELANTDVVDLTTTETISYSMLHDNLPPGLSLTSSGFISGKVSTLPTNGDSLSYEFAVRANDGTYSRDRQFSMVANVSSAQTNPPEWGSLPPEVTKLDAQPSPFKYVPLGSTARGNPFTYQISIFEPPGTQPPILDLNTFIGDTTITAPFNTIPPGLSLDANTAVISGSVDASAALGKYYFEVAMLDNHGDPILTGSGATPKVFMIEVSPPGAALEPLRFIIWQTEPGLLVTLPEAQAFPVGVRAICTTGESIQYSIASPNMPLPPGLNLNPTTGDIEGILSHVEADQTFTFTIRAKVSDTFSDRTFSIKVLARYNVETFFNMTFKLRVKTSKPMSDYYDDIIDASEYFRADDPNYGPDGVRSSMNIFLAGGLAGDMDSIETIVRQSNIEGVVRLMLGEHKIAYGKINGQVVYEVLYREIIDPLARAGGWKLVDGKPVEDPVRYPESPPNASTYIHPASIKNIRYEFVSKLGFPSLDPNKEFDMTATGAENLPLWMTCPQNGNLISSALGYVPAAVIGYLKPGSGQDVLDRISLRPTPEQRPTDAADPVVEGHLVEFDQYFMLFQTMGLPTTFDGETTSWNIDNIRFDTLVYTTGKFYRMNRSNWP